MQADVTFCIISNQLKEICIRSCSTNKWMLVELGLRMLLGFLKAGGGSCIPSTHVDWAPGLLVACCVLHNYCQLMRLPPRPKDPQEDPLCCVRGQMPLLCEGWIVSQCEEAMHVALFTNWMIVYANPIWCYSWALWKYRCIRSEILLYWFEIWNTSPLGGLLALTICKIENIYIQFYFLDEKNAKNLAKNPLWIYRCIRFEILFNYFEIWNTSA